ncbi:hypothetical protein MTO96_036593, partial [Rhipicephalus appendiculatus]
GNSSLNYVLLGPSNAKRNNCSGLLTIAQSPKPDGGARITHTSPAKEEYSNVLTLTCGPTVVDGTRGVADVRFAYVLMSDQRAFGTDFLFPLDFYRLAYLYPSPEILRNSFTVLEIFSLTTWFFWGTFFWLITVVLRATTFFDRRFLGIRHVDKAFFLVKNTVLPHSKKSRVRILLLARYLLIFIIGHCFTSGYISLLNKPNLTEVPDTKVKLMAFLRNGRLEPCMVKNYFEHILMTRSDHPPLLPLKNAVRNWTKFTTDAMATCMERTIQGQAVYFGSASALEPHMASSRGQVQISRVYAEDLMFPSSLLLPKASPYKQVLNRV